MNYAVKYHTRSGNSKKLADAIAEAVNVNSTDVTVPLEEKADLVFLCSALYAGDVDKEVKDFICNNKDKIGIICNVSSAASKKTTLNRVKKCAEENGVSVHECEFFCNGSFLFMHKGRPNEKDLQDAKSFAKSIVEQFENV